jgi:hypothetical protein
VLSRLRNETYIGTLLYNRTSQKLKTPRHLNPPEVWVRTAEAFDGIVSTEQFTRAQEIFEERRRKYDPDRMLGQLRDLYKHYGVFRSSLLRLQEDLPKAGAYARQFGSWDQAFQQLYCEQRDRAREMVHEQIRSHVSDVLPYADFLVLDQKLALSVQPAVPIPSGYAAWRDANGSIARGPSRPQPLTAARPRGDRPSQFGNGSFLGASEEFSLADHLVRQLSARSTPISPG